jgi:arabinofuranosyltransferase
MNKKTMIVLAVAVLFICWSSLFIFNSSFIVDGTRYFCLFDDAMISLRYAWNLSQGTGLVWNEGERVEGFTNMLMTLYMSVWTFFLDKNYAVLAVQISGICFMLVTAYFLMKIGEKIVSKDEPNRNLILTLVFLIPLTYYPLVYWTLMGMEVGMLAAFLAAAIYFSLNYPDRFILIIPILLGLAFLTRPDAAIAIAIAVILLFRAYWLITAKKFYLVIRDYLIVGLFVSGISLFRLIYYGNIFPNTYTLKATGMDLWFRITENGLAFTFPFLTSISVLLFLGLLTIIFRPNRHFIFFYTLFISIMFYQIYIGGDAWPYWRQTAPYVPYLYLPVILHFHQLAGAYRQEHWNGMGSLPGHNKYDLNYSIVGKMPTYIQGYMWGEQNVSDFVSKNYVIFKSNNNQQELLLLRDSQQVYWGKIGEI